MGRTRTIHTILSVGVLTGLVSLFFASTARTSQAAPGKLIMGYAAGWSIGGRTEAAALDGNKFTHLIYAFVGISGNSCTASWTDPSPPNVSIDATKMANIVDGLIDNKQENPSLKVILSIGGGGYTAGFEAITNYDDFATSCYNLMVARRADGLDLDYEFPETDAERTRHRAIVAALHKKLHPATGTRYQLSVGLPASSYYGQWIDAAAIQPEVDYFTTMAYNYHGAWETIVNFNSPKECGDGLCMTGTASYWTGTRYLPKSKVVIGLGYYGNQYTTSAGCNALGGGYAAVTTIDYRSMRTNGMLSGGTSAGSGWSRSYHPTYKNPALCNGSTWVGYEDPQSAQERANWLRMNSYPGIMVWEVFKDYNSEMINAICADYGCGTSPTATRTSTSAPSAPTATSSSTSAPSAPSATSSSSYPAWSPNNVYYAVGARVTYLGSIYECTYAHNSQSAWNPVDWPGGWKKLSSTAPSATSAPAVPATPQNLSAVARSSSAIDLSWGAVSGATSYQILRCSGAGCTPSTQVATASSASYADSGLTASTTYVYRVKALSSAGASAASSSASATTQGTTAATATRTRTATSASAPTATRTATSSSSAAAWAPGIAYQIGQLATYGGYTYRVTQAHTSQIGWEPPNAAALWTRV